MLPLFATLLFLGICSAARAPLHTAARPKATAVFARSGLCQPDVASAFQATGTGGGWPAGKLGAPFMVNKTVTLEPMSGDETIERDGFETIDLRARLAEAGITEESWDPSSQTQRMALGSVMIRALEDRFGRRVLHLADTSRLTDEAEYGEATVRDTSSRTHRGSHHIFHLDKWWPGIEAVYESETTAMAIERVLENWRFWKKDWKELGIPLSEGREAMMPGSSGRMVNVWTSLTAGGITQRPLALIDPATLTQHRSDGDEYALTVPLPIARDTEDTITLIKDQPGLRVMYRPKMPFGEAFVFDTTQVPHSAVWLEGAPDAPRRSGELRALILSA